MAAGCKSGNNQRRRQVTEPLEPSDSHQHAMNITTQPGALSMHVARAQPWLSGDDIQYDMSGELERIRLWNGG